MSGVPSVVEVTTGTGSYPVVVGRGWLERLEEHLPLPPAAVRALVVTQQPIVEAGWVAAVEDALQRAGLQVHRQVVPDGEPAKELGVLARLWRACAEMPLSRDDLVVAVGGGVAGDLAGFAAAAFNRGVAVLQVPTTLLAQVDAAIGGKTGINLPEGKNLVGAFHAPCGVACDVETLATLPARVRVEGLAEVIKAGLIRDPGILELLEADPGAASSGDPGMLVELVERAVRVKAAVVGADEREHGERAHLNFGHTYGHVLEALTGYASLLHGEAVAIGTVVALRLGERLGHTPNAVVERGTALIERVGLPTWGPVLDREEVWSVMARDKKAGRDGVRFVVLEDIARPVLVTPARADVDAVLDTMDAEAGG